MEELVVSFPFAIIGIGPSLSVHRNCDRESSRVHRCHPYSSPWVKPLSHPSASIQSRADPYIFICGTLVLYGTYGLTKFSMPQFYFFHWNLLTNYILN
eukprot:SAG11_NODE_22512_length_404_cov_5.311475_1_plen_97_part_10